METNKPKYQQIWILKKNEWNEKKKEPKNKALLLVLNRMVADLELNIHKKLVEGEQLTLETIKSFYSTSKEDKSFYYYYLDFVKRKRKEGLNPETIRVYKTTYNVLKAYKEKILISDICLPFIEHFDYHMRDINGNSAGGRNPKHKNIRTVILDMEKHSILVNNPYKWFKIPSSQTKEIYLDKTELNALIEYTKQFATDSKEYQILKMSQFSCFCGLRFSDTITLTWENVDFENSIIRKTMIKTKTDVITPMFPMARDILVEWSRKKKVIANKPIFDSYAEPTVNQTLRKQTKLAGIKKYITYHTARHTFGTFLGASGIASAFMISKLMGHSDLTMTQTFINLSNEDAKDTMNKFWNNQQ